MQKFVRRAVWFSVWAATYAIIVWLCMELAENQPVILAVLLLSGIVASIGLVYARQSFAAGSWSGGMSALLVTALALTTCVIGEISYWSGTIESIHEQVTRDRSISEGKSLVRQRQAERYSALANGQSAEALQAGMAAALTKTIAGVSLGTRTAGCTDTSSPHYKSCTAYFDLKAQFAAANEAAKLEGVVSNFNTSVEPVGLKRDFYRAAVWLHDMTGWKVESCIAGIAAIIVSLLQSLLMLSLYIGSTPERRQEAARATLQPRREPGATPELKRAMAAAAPPVPVVESKEEKPVPFRSPEVAKAAPLPAEVERHLPNPPRIVVNNDREGNDDFPEKYRGKKAKGPSAQSHARQSASVRKWLGMCNQTENHKVCADSDAVWDAYSAWLRATGEHGFVKRKPMIAELGRVYFKGGQLGRRGPRTANGSKFPGLVPYHPATPLRATA
jgi:hypothetical protein